MQLLLVVLCLFYNFANFKRDDCSLRKQSVLVQLDGIIRNPAGCTSAKNP